MITLVDKSLSQELLDVLKILFFDNLGQGSESVCLKHVIISLLNIFGQTTDNDEHLVFIYVQLLDEHVDKSSQVLIKLISLRLRNLEKLGDVEKHLTLLVFGKLMTLIQQENDFVEKIDALLFFQCFVIENIGLLHES